MTINRALICKISNKRPSCIMEIGNHRPKKLRRREKDSRNFIATRFSLSLSRDEYSSRIIRPELRVTLALYYPIRARERESFFYQPQVMPKLFFCLCWSSALNLQVRVYRWLRRRLGLRDERSLAYTWSVCVAGRGQWSVRLKCLLEKYIFAGWAFCVLFKPGYMFDRSLRIDIV